MFCFDYDLSNLIIYLKLKFQHYQKEMERKIKVYLTKPRQTFFFFFCFHKKQGSVTKQAATDISLKQNKTKKSFILRFLCPVVIEKYLRFHKVC